MAAAISAGSCERFGSARVTVTSSASGSSASRIAAWALSAEIESTRCVRRRGRRPIARARARAEFSVWAPSTRIHGARDKISARPGSSHGGEAARSRGREHGVGDSRAPDAGERERRVRRLVRPEHGNARLERERPIAQLQTQPAGVGGEHLDLEVLAEPGERHAELTGAGLDHAPGRLG